MIFFPHVDMNKEKQEYPKEQGLLIIMDKLKSSNIDILKKLCSRNNCKVMMVPHNLTNKFQPMDISVNKTAKNFFKIDITIGFQTKCQYN